ncbi:MAG: SpoIIE family protein phosphatase [Actinobacteria bacterium]|nr:SpoIIE family protein phosphatase [Actinomycetota bacterium]
MRSEESAAALASGGSATVAVELLKDVARALGGHSRLEVILQDCAQAIVDRVDAAFARVWTLDAAAETLVLRASAGMYTHVDGGHARVPVGSFKIGRIAQRREPHLSNDVANDPELSDPEWARREAMVSFAGYPLIVGEDLVGVLGLFARRPLEESVLGLLEAVADAIALGIRRAQAERELRIQGEIAEVLYRAGTAVAQVHNLESIVQTVIDLTTELTDAQFGAFFYNAIDERGEAYTLYTLSGAPREAFARFPLPRNTQIFAPTFDGRSIERLADVTADPRFGRNEPYFGMPEGHLPVRSYLAVPVVSRSGEVLGGLFFGHADVGVFNERAERIAVGMAGHAGAAVDAARVFELEHRLALNFQRTLMGGEVPLIRGARLVQRYVPANELAEVGGDWHDLITLPDGTLAITVGDVVGHDLRAAVTMGRLRNAIQLYALDGHPPAETLALAERYLQRAGVDDLATVIHARYEPKGHRLQIVRAGHPPPIVRHPNGLVQALSQVELDGTVIGIGRTDRAEVTVDLEPGTIVLFFTDGLIERRDESFDDGVERLKLAVAEAATSPYLSFCDILIDLMVEDSAADDIAIVALFVDELNPS